MYEYEKESKGHPVLTIILFALISAACGLGGGYYAVTHFGVSSGSEEEVVIQHVQSSESSGGSAKADDTTVAAVAAKAAPSVVEIMTEVTSTSYGIFGGTYTSEAAGSGVIISEDGYIVTNDHVIEDAETIQVTLYDGTVYDAVLVGTDSKSDIAVIKVEAESLTAAEIGDSSAIAAGDLAVVIGNPLGTLGGTVTDGIISAVSREITINRETMSLIQTNAAINSGNSGGGLFNKDGQLIGIVNAKDSGTSSSGTIIEGLGFAIPVNTAMDVAEQLITNGKVVNRATLGIYLQEVTSSTSNYPAGIYITGIIEGSGAEAAGLETYDRIINVDGQDISTYTELSRILRDKSVGDTISVTVVRDDKEVTVNVTLTGVLDTTE